MNSEQEQGKDQGKQSDWQLRARLLDTASILLSGEIDKALAEKIIAQLLLMEHMEKDVIKIFIDSPGGDVDAGYAIFDMIRFINARVYTIGMGLVASAGALILLAPPKEQRLGLPNSHYLIHQPLAGLRGVASDIEIHAREIEKTRKRINQLIAAETGTALEKVEMDTDRDFWMSAEEATGYGLISKVINTCHDFEDIDSIIKGKAGLTKDGPKAKSEKSTKPSKSQ